MATGTGDGRVQSRGMRGQRMYAFLVAVLSLNITLVIADHVEAPLELATAVVWAVVGLAAILVMGRSGVHIVEAWAASKLGTGTVTERKVEETTVTKE